MWPVLLFSSATLAACILYLRRRLSLIREVREVISTAALDVQVAMLRIITLRVQNSLPQYGNGIGLASVSVMYREPQDTYENCRQLLVEIANASRSERISDALKLLRMLYQFIYSIDVSPSEYVAFIGFAENRLKQATDAGSLYRLEMVLLDTPVDQRIMAPVNFGTHVEAAFGPIIYDKDGKVLHKSKVFCR